MTDTNDTDGTDWEAFMESANERYLEAFERNVDAQASFVESWMDTIDESTDADHLENGLDGYARAYKAWMEAAEDQVEQLNATMEGEDVSTEAFRDRWLNAANEAFKEVMSTSAFAATTGETIESVLDVQQEADEYAEETLHTLGFATVSDIHEVGERLLEVERRQQTIEDKLDTVIEEIQE